MLAFLGANFVATIFLTWAPTFLVEKFGFKLASAGLSGTIFIHLASAVSVPETAKRIGQLYVPMQQAMEKVFSAYTDEELRLLLRFANEGYEGVVAATAALKGLLDTPPEQRPDLKLKKHPRRT